MDEFLDERPKHAGKVLCLKHDALVRNHHHRDSSGVVTWGRSEPCEGPHKRLAIVDIEGFGGG